MDRGLHTGTKSAVYDCIVYDGRDSTDDIVGPGKATGRVCVCVCLTITRKRFPPVTVNSDIRP